MHERMVRTGGVRKKNENRFFLEREADGYFATPVLHQFADPGLHFVSP
jgi:hypothetical protein